MEELINSILSRRLPCLFVSPHLDDAVLSCADLLVFLSGKVPITVATLFTQSSPPPVTLSVKVFLKRAGYKSSEEFYQARREEDIRVMEAMGVNGKHFGFVDASWRKINNPGTFREMAAKVLPEAVHVYPVYRLHVQKGKVFAHDRELKNLIIEKLDLLINQLGGKNNCVVFCPAGIGGHVDHVLAREVCMSLNLKKLIFYGDFPYSIRQRVIPNLPQDYEPKELFLGTTSNKERLTKMYATQFKLLFPNSIFPIEPEVYYLKQKIYENEIQG